MSTNSKVRVIDQEMQGIGGQKLDMPSLCSADLWKTSERWDLMGKELFRLKDRHGVDYCLGPTHEEAVTTLVAHQATLSYRQLPLLLYQITRKFRDEPKPKFGLLRGREFYMKDMYSFDVSEEAAYQTYESVCQAYTRLFARLGLRCVQVQADTGNIGGTLSHEFQLPADIGEDRLLVCGNCSFSANVETMSADRTDCPQCKTGTLVESKGIEVGHTFYLGKKYSHVFNAAFSNAQNKPSIAEMGCYGLGVTRILAAAIEVIDSDDGMDEFMDKFKTQRYKNGFNEDTWEEEFNKVPMFMKTAPEEIDPRQYPELACIQAIVHDEDRPPEEQAQSLKDEGNSFFKDKNYEKAILAYTAGLKKKCGNQDLDTVLLTNRAAAHFYLGNMRSALNDAVAAKKIKPDHVKALIRDHLAVMFGEELPPWDTDRKYHPQNLT
eukprot:superscaffoldBa00000256_g3246